MGPVIPAILPHSREDLDEKLRRLRGITDQVQIDIVDGTYAAPATWPYASGSPEELATAGDVPELAAFRFEVDLMVKDPETVIGTWVHAGAARVTVHAESTRNLAQVVRDFSEKYGHDKGFAPDLLAFGLALTVDTDLALVEPYLEDCDYVQFMGIAHIGKQGEPFDERVLEKIHTFHKAHPDIPVQVDGGVSKDTAARLMEAGASRVVVGSALWKAPDLKKEIDEFCQIAQTRGLYT